MAVWLRDLPAALAGWGFSVTEEPGWQSRGHGPLLRSPRGVGSHWTATPLRTGNPFPTAHLVTSGRSDLAGPLANLMLGFDGQPRIIAAGLAYHFGAADRPRNWSMTGNSDVIGIECEGAGIWTSEQVRNYPRLVAALWHWYSDIKFSNLISHQEWAPSRKIDIKTWPGGMDAFRASVKNAQKSDQDGWMMATTKNPYDGNQEDVAFVVGQLELRIRNGLLTDFKNYFASDEFQNAVAERVVKRLMAEPVQGVLTVLDDGTEVRQTIEVARAFSRGAEAPVSYRRDDTHKTEV